MYWSDAKIQTRADEWLKDREVLETVISARILLFALALATCMACAASSCQ